MKIEQFKKMCVRTIIREIDLFEYRDKCTVQFGQLLSDNTSSLKISGTVKISFNNDSNTYEHIIPICWRSGWGVGYEDNTGFHAIKLTTLLQSMYFDLAIKK